MPLSGTHTHTHTHTHTRTLSGCVRRIRLHGGGGRSAEKLPVFLNASCSVPLKYDSGKTHLALLIGPCNLQSRASLDPFCPRRHARKLRFGTNRRLASFFMSVRFCHEWGWRGSSIQIERRERRSGSRHKDRSWAEKKQENVWNSQGRSKMSAWLMRTAHSHWTLGVGRLGGAA